MSYTDCMRLNDVCSASYNTFLKGVGEHLTTIVVGVKNLPANVVKALPASSTSGSYQSKIELLPQLDRNTLMKVVYWIKKVYLRRKKGKAKAGTEDEDDEDADLDDPKSELSGEGAELQVKGSVTSCYMEDENGDTIPESERDAARATAKAFWVKLSKKNAAPTHFGALDIDLKHEHFLLMETSFPWLHYCENRWKAEQLWRNHYPPWIRGEQKREKEAEQRAAREAAQKATKEAVEKAAAEGNLIEVDLDSSDVQDDQGKSPKRSRPDDEESGQPKRRRVMVINPALSSRPGPIQVTTTRRRVRLIVLVDYIYH